MYRFVSRRRKRQFIDTDDSIISLTDDLGGNFLQDIDVGNLLPSITDDPSNTCPNEISACDPSYPYRSFTGYCNNLHKPNYGKSLSTFSRILPPAYENGMLSFRIQVTLKQIKFKRASHYVNIIIFSITMFQYTI